MTNKAPISSLTKGMLFSFVDSELSADMITVLDVAIPYNTETNRKMPGIALLTRMPTGVDATYYLPKNFNVYFPEVLDK